MIIECHSSDGFEDQLTTDTAYLVKEVGANSYLIQNDNEEQAWYGTSHFKISLND